MVHESRFLILFTLLRKNESNSNWVNCNSLLLIKYTFLSCVDFTRLNDFKWCTQIWIVWVNSNFILKNNNYQKYAKKSYSSSLSNIQSDLCDNNDHNDPGLCGIRTRSLILSIGTEAECASDIIYLFFFVKDLSFMLVPF